MKTPDLIETELSAPLSQQFQACAQAQPETPPVPMPETDFEEVETHYRRLPPPQQQPQRVYQPYTVMIGNTVVHRGWM